MDAQSSLRARHLKRSMLILFLLSSFNLLHDAIALKKNDLRAVEVLLNVVSKWSLMVVEVWTYSLFPVSTLAVKVRNNTTEYPETAAIKEFKMTKGTSFVKTC